MKASIYKDYGNPEVLELVDIEIPEPGSNAIQIKVMATSVNRTDCANLTAKPFLKCFINGMFRPKTSIIGSEFSGVISRGEKTGNVVINIGLLYSVIRFCGRSSIC